MTAEIVSITNQKGGVGKTTTTVNLAASLALAERKTLVIDFDPQGNASSALGIDRARVKESATIYDVLIGRKTAAEAIINTEIDYLSIIPANSDLAGAEIELVGSFAREYKLKSALESIRDQFDYILIDSPPSLGLLTINSLTAAEKYLVPLQCEFFALEGMNQLLETVRLIRGSVNPSLEEDGIVLTMHDQRNKLSIEVESGVRAHFQGRVYRTVIPRNVRLSECSSHGKPIVLYDVESKGSAAYLGLAREFLERRQNIDQALTSSFGENLEVSHFIGVENGI